MNAAAAAAVLCAFPGEGLLLFSLRGDAAAAVAAAASAAAVVAVDGAAAAAGAAAATVSAAAAAAAVALVDDKDIYNRVVPMRAGKTNACVIQDTNTFLLFFLLERYRWMYVMMLLWCWWYCWWCWWRCIYDR